MSDKRFSGSFLIGVVTGLSAAATYAFIVRPWHLRWGATDYEVECVYPGDLLMPFPKIRATHAIDIQAPISMVWPWLVQLGQGRGGFYSYDWIENLMGLDIHTEDHLMPEFHNLKVGDVVPLSADGFGFPVAIIEPESTLVLHGDTRIPGTGEVPNMRPGDYIASTWGFYLHAKSFDTTRLVERWTADWNPSLANWLIYRVFLEPGAFVMQRKMLLGIKERSENLAGTYET